MGMTALYSKLEPETALTLESITYNFRIGFFNEHRQKYFIVRTHFGSYIALGLAIHNLYNIRQVIIKYAIQMTRSKNPLVIRFTSGYLGLLYFGALFTVWHIPSFAVHVGLSLFNGCMLATLNALCPFQEVFAEKLLCDEDLIRETLQKTKIN